MMLFWFSLFGIGFTAATVAYLFALRAKLMAVVDLIWTSGLGLGVVAYHLAAGLNSLHSWVVLLFALFWSSRLSFHLLKDRVLPGHEDPRYRALAQYWGEHAKVRFYYLFLAQIVFVALFLYPISVAMEAQTEGWAWTSSLALIIAVIALLGEWLADRQLAAFRQNPENKGKVCRDGLWRYSRHPNYFFEWLHWFAYVAFAAGALGSWLGPLAMFIFLRFLTGVPPAERSSLKSRGDAYRHYQATTNAFFPWIPRKQPSS